MEILGAIATFIGSVILLIASIGLVRMPDIYNRLQVGTKATTLGTILTLFGLLMVEPSWWGKLILLIFFIMMTNPVSSHVLARAAYFIKIPLTNLTVVDKLKLDKQILKIAVEDKNEIKPDSIKN